MNSPGNKRILAVDDSPTYQKLLGGFLSRMGYDTTVEATAKAGLLHLQESTTDLVVFSAVLPDMDVLTHIMRLKVHQDITLCLISSQDQEEERDIATRNGVNAGLVKPFQFHTLRKTVEGLIGPPLPKT